MKLSLCVLVHLLLAVQIHHNTKKCACALLPVYDIGHNLVDMACGLTGKTNKTYMNDSDIGKHCKYNGHTRERQPTNVYEMKATKGGGDVIKETRKNKKVCGQNKKYF